MTPPWHCVTKYRLEHVEREAEPNPQDNLLYIAANGQVRAHFWETKVVPTVVNGVTKTITVSSRIPFTDEVVRAAATTTTKKKNNKKTSTTTTTTKKKVAAKTPVSKAPSPKQKQGKKTTTTTTTTKKKKPKTTTTTTTTKKKKPKTTTTTTTTKSKKPKKSSSTTTTTTKSKKNPVKTSSQVQPDTPTSALSSLTSALSGLTTRRTTSTITSTVTVPQSSDKSTVTSLTTLISLSVSANQTASPTVVATSGELHSSLDTSGNPSSQPFATSIAATSSSLSLIDTASTTLPSTSMAASRPTIEAANLFAPMASDAPPSQIPQRSDHPVPRLNIAAQSKKLSTNKFYSNFLLGSQSQATWVQPYSLTWAKGSGVVKSWGMAISHIERGQLAFDTSTNPPRYFFGPVGIQSFIFSAQGLGSNAVLSTDSLTAFSANVNLALSAGASPIMTFPLVQGMGYVTARYNNASPLLQSSVSILSLLYSGKVNNTNVFKYKAGLGDQTTWLIYVTPDSASYPGNTFTLTDAQNINGTAGFTGTIQIAKLPSSTPGGEGLFDSSAGVYATSARVSGSASGTTGTYTLSFSKGGLTSRSLLMFALPHHLQSLTSGGKTNINLQTITKGIATAIVGDSWTLSEPDLPTDIGFAPWTVDAGTVTNVSADATQLILEAGTSELSQDIDAQSNLDSMYFSGKGLAKFASIIYAVNDLGKNKTIAYTGLQRLQTAFATFVNNNQQYPLTYESAWGGVVSTGSYTTGDAGQDFGNTYYNDHHFHYAYFVYAASVIGYLDPTWLTQQNRDWVNMLVRDFGNPSDSDPYFPFSRSYDWYNGHSWAKGLFESADGKDQESSSEDSLACYAIKMWGRISGDVAMEARGALMMAVQKRAVQSYYLFASDNSVQPSRFIPNKVAGILFENKLDHATYFGLNIEYIQGIHMIPLFPFSPYVRSRTFVQEEWDTYFSNGRVDSIAAGWRGILYANLALIDPTTSWNWFSNRNFDVQYLDGGASLTWYRAWSAALGGSRG
ncbi:Glycosyl hydrolase family 81 C-terminal domain-containing protein [Elsinoe fawcettii]|nr:Glycosyl hydrolase family 81 C-terminal domain-containing protein [Elsinoe fawcettii]